MKRMRITVNGVTYEVEVDVLDEDEGINDGFPLPTSLRPRAPEPARGTPPAPAPAAPPAGDAASDKALTSPVSGIVVEVKVSVGSVVKENDPVVVLEAMKMNTNVSSPVAGRVRTIEARVGEAVRQGQVLLTFE
jgi:glutaconyl-CoA/methylmalonyl-CoA decarboxylase subunit gamma